MLLLACWIHAWVVDHIKPQERDFSPQQSVHRLRALLALHLQRLVVQGPHVLVQHRQHGAVRGILGHVHVQQRERPADGLLSVDRVLEHADRQADAALGTTVRRVRSLMPAESVVSSAEHDTKGAAPIALMAASCKTSSMAFAYPSKAYVVQWLADQSACSCSCKNSPLVTKSVMGRPRDAILKAVMNLGGGDEPQMVLPVAGITAGTMKDWIVPWTFPARYGMTWCRPLKTWLGQGSSTSSATERPRTDHASKKAPHGTTTPLLATDRRSSLGMSTALMPSAERYDQGSRAGRDRPSLRPYRTSCTLSMEMLLG